MAAFEITQDEYNGLLRYARSRCNGNFQDAQDALSVAILKLFESSKCVEGSAFPLLLQGIRWEAAHLARRRRGILDLSYGDGDMDNCDVLDGRVPSSSLLRPVESAVEAREKHIQLLVLHNLFEPLRRPAVFVKGEGAGRLGRKGKKSSELSKRVMASFP